jgi:MFS family permease
MSGIRFVAHSREIRNVFFLIAVFSIIGLPYISLLPIFAAEVFHKGAQGLGFLVGASGIGALTAALGIAALGDIRDKTRFMATTGLCFSLALLAFSLSGIFWLSLLVIMAAGWGMVSYLAAANSFIQVTVPDELRGRVMSVYSLVFLGTVPIGNAVMGFVADMVGTPRAVTASGVICLLAAGVFARRYLAKQDGV